MPVVSQAQNRAMHAAAQGHSTLGIPAAVGRDFVDASHGMKVSKLPKRVRQPSAPKGGAKQRPIFGSLSPTS